MNFFGAGNKPLFTRTLNFLNVNAQLAHSQQRTSEHNFPIPDFSQNPLTMQNTASTTGQDTPILESNSLNAVRNKKESITGKRAEIQSRHTIHPIVDECVLKLDTKEFHCKLKTMEGSFHLKMMEDLPTEVGLRERYYFSENAINTVMDLLLEIFARQLDEKKVNPCVLFRSLTLRLLEDCLKPKVGRKGDRLLHVLVRLKHRSGPILRNLIETNIKFIEKMLNEKLSVSECSFFQDAKNAEGLDYLALDHQLQQENDTNTSSRGAFQADWVIRLLNPLPDLRPILISTEELRNLVLSPSLFYSRYFSKLLFLKDKENGDSLMHSVVRHFCQSSQGPKFQITKLLLFAILQYRSAGKNFLNTKNSNNKYFWEEQDLTPFESKWLLFWKLKIKKIFSYDVKKTFFSERFLSDFLNKLSKIEFKEIERDLLSNLTYFLLNSKRFSDLNSKSTILHRIVEKIWENGRKKDLMCKNLIALENFLRKKPSEDDFENDLIDLLLQERNKDNLTFNELLRSQEIIHSGDRSEQVASGSKYPLKILPYDDILIKSIENQLSTEKPKRPSSVPTNQDITHFRLSKQQLLCDTPPKKMYAMTTDSSLIQTVMDLFKRASKDLVLKGRTMVYRGDTLLHISVRRLIFDKNFQYSQYEQLLQLFVKYNNYNLQRLCNVKNRIGELFGNIQGLSSLESDRLHYTVMCAIDQEKYERISRFRQKIFHKLLNQKCEDFKELETRHYMDFFVISKIDQVTGNILHWLVKNIWNNGVENPIIHHNFLALKKFLEQNPLCNRLVLLLQEKNGSGMTCTELYESFYPQHIAAEKYEFTAQDSYLMIHYTDQAREKLLELGQNDEERRKSIIQGIIKEAKEVFRLNLHQAHRERRVNINLATQKFEKKLTKSIIKV